MNAITTVPFHNQNLFLIEHNSEPFTVMKPIVEGMGLAWQSQLAKLKANAKRWGITEIVTPSKSGEQSTVCMPVRKLPAYMASIYPNKVKKELRETIEMFQDECDNALWSYWSKGEAVNPRATITPAEQRTIQETVASLSKDDKAYAKRYGAIKTRFKVAKYDQLLISDYDEALELLHTMAIEPAAIEEKQAAIPEGMVLVSRQNLNALIQINEKSAEVYGDRIQELEIMVTDASIKMVEFRSRSWDAVRDGAWIAKTLKQDLENKGAAK